MMTATSMDDNNLKILSNNHHGVLALNIQVSHLFIALVTTAPRNSITGSWVHFSNNDIMKFNGS